NLTLRSTLFFLYFNHTPAPHIYTLSLHYALPISSSRVNDNETLLLGHIVPPADVHFNRRPCRRGVQTDDQWRCLRPVVGFRNVQDRKSTRLNSSHVVISYAVFCLK